MFSKYNILIYLTAPVLILFIIRIYDNFKRKKISKKSALIFTLIWLIISLGILLNKLFFDSIRHSKLTDSTPLSLYDVVQISAIIFLIYVSFRQSFKIDELKNKLTKLNQEIALKDYSKD